MTKRDRHFFTFISIWVGVQIISLVFFGDKSPIDGIHVFFITILFIWTFLLGRNKQ